MAAWHHDKLDRAPIAIAFETIAQEVQGGGVIIVDAGFGMGKTFFVENWQQSLTDRGIPVAVFDAWRNDFLENPLAGFISTLKSQIESIEDDNAKLVIRKKLAKFAQSAAPMILKSGIRVGLRLISMGALDGDVDTIREVIAEEGIHLADNVSNDVILAFENTISQKQFHRALETEFNDLVDALRGDSDHPLLVLVDELDRCRPEFSLALLEDIKHFLGASNVVFFIFCDEDVLQSQAARIFGDKSSGEKYIAKFCTHKLRLPERSNYQLMSDAISKSVPDIEDYSVRYLCGLCETCRATVRQSLNILNFLAVLKALDGGLVLKAWPVTFVIAVMREVRPSEYSRFLRYDDAGTFTFLGNDDEEFGRLSEAVMLFFHSAPDKRSSQIINADSEFDGRVLELFMSLCSEVGKSGKMFELRKHLIERSEFAASIAR